MRLCIRRALRRILLSTAAGAVGILSVACSVSPDSPSLVENSQALNSSADIAFQANTTSLWFQNAPQNLGMQAGTNPAVAALVGGGQEIAFQANTGNLWVTGSLETRDLGLGMAANTSPAIGGLAGGGYEVAFQANTTALWIAGSVGTQSLGLGMMPGTSPSITALAAGGYQIAFQANTGNLWVTGTLGTIDLGLGMRAGTSPSIVALPGGGYEVAFQANTTSLWVAGTLETRDLGLGMMPGTSPSIAADPNGGYEIAFQANTGKLWLAGSRVTADLDSAMAQGTSPSITPLSRDPSGRIVVAFQNADTRLSTATFVPASARSSAHSYSTSLGLGMAAGTSPAVLGNPVLGKWVLGSDTGTPNGTCYSPGSGFPNACGDLNATCTNRDAGCYVGLEGSCSTSLGSGFKRLQLYRCQ